MLVIIFILFSYIGLPIDYISLLLSFIQTFICIIDFGFKGGNIMRNRYNVVGCSIYGVILYDCGVQ